MYVIFQLHTTIVDDGLDWNRLNLKSVTEENTLDEFLSTAEMAGTEFSAGRLQSVVINLLVYFGALFVYSEVVIVN